MEATIILWYPHKPQRKPETYHLREEGLHDPIIIATEDLSGRIMEIQLLPTDSPTPELLQDEFLEQTSGTMFVQFGIPAVWEGFAAITFVVEYDKLVAAIHRDPLPVHDIYADYLAKRGTRAKFFTLSAKSD